MLTGRDIKMRRLLVAGGFSWLLFRLPMLTAEDDVSNPEQLVAHHLESLGPAKARAEAKTRVAEGMVEFRISTGGAGVLNGKSVFVSEGRKLHLMMKFANNQYRGERFIWNEDKVQIAAATARQDRSSFGEFLRGQDAVIREGLLGGVLSTAWPLLNLEDRKPRLSYEGLKTIDGQQLYDLRYRPQRSTDLDIHLYFDPQTFRHVRTVYKLTVEPSIGVRETDSARQQETRYRIDERFSDFQTVDGLVLPAPLRPAIYAGAPKRRDELMDVGYN